MDENRDKIPRAIWAIGFVSLFMDASSELIHALLPALYLSLGVSMATVGIIEGIAEATAAITKVFSGALSDWLGKRKLLAVIGYGLAALTKPLFPLAHSVEVIFAARFIDRVGKGIRGAPRDALVADITPESVRGEAYGLRQSLDAAGGFIGPILALTLMFLLSDNITLSLWFAVIPAILCMAFLIFGVDEPKNVPSSRAKGKKNGLPLNRADLVQLNGQYWLVVIIGTLFSLARFSVAFLALRAMELGLPVGMSPAVLILMGIVFSLSSYPVGLLADRMDRGKLLALGFIALIGADLLLANATHYGLALAGVAVWGMHLGLTQGLLSTLVADSAPDHLRGTAFGIFNLANGIALLIASLVAGSLWQMLGASMTFYTGASFAAGALVLLLVSFRSKHWA
ncbi:MAG TPA: MFS transporter [Rhizobiales bacterium]|nr:MFS transporter [Hyphomicrobiales bacterium]